MIRKYAKLDGVKIVDLIICDDTLISEFAGNYVDVSSEPMAETGWTFDGQNFFKPSVEEKEKKRVIISIPDWIQTFTDSEWSLFRRAAYDRQSVVGYTITENFSGSLRQFFDTVDKMKEADLKSRLFKKFYNSLENKGLITQARKDELQSGG